MNPNKTAEPLGLDYDSVSALAETISKETGLRSVGNLEPLISAMGGAIARTSLAEWSAADALAVDVRGLRDFTVFLGSEPTPLDRLLIASALGHYILHAQEGRRPASFRRFAKDGCSVEALWFGMSIVIPDGPFAIAEASDTFNDAMLAEMFKAPEQLIALKRKLRATSRRAHGAAARPIEPHNV